MPIDEEDKLRDESSTLKKEPKIVKAHDALPTTVREIHPDLRGCLLAAAFAAGIFFCTFPIAAVATGIMTVPSKAVTGLACAVIFLTPVGIGFGMVGGFLARAIGRLFSGKWKPDTYWLIGGVGGGLTGAVLTAVVLSKLPQ